MMTPHKPMDPDLVRLLQGDVILHDTPEKSIVACRLAIVNKTPISDEDLDAIPDEGTRNIMKKWNRLFP